MKVGRGGGGGGGGGGEKEQKVVHYILIADPSAVLRLTVAGLLSIGTPPIWSTNCTHTCWNPPSSGMVNAGCNSPAGGTILAKRSAVSI